MKITKEHIGMWVAVPSIGNILKILSIDSRGINFFAEDKDGFGSLWNTTIDTGFERVNPPKQKKLLAPAFFKYKDTRGPVTGISTYLFESREEADLYCKDIGPASIISWPAIPNKEGFFVVEE